MYDRNIRLCVDIEMIDSDIGFIITIEEDTRSCVVAIDALECTQHPTDNRYEPKLHESMSVFSSLIQILHNIWLLFV